MGCELSRYFRKERSHGYVGRGRDSISILGNHSTASRIPYRTNKRTSTRRDIRIHGSAACVKSVEQKENRTCFRQESGQQIYILTGRTLGGSRGSANKLRAVLFTSSRKLDTKADRREQAAVQLRMATGARRMHAERNVSFALAATRTDTFTYFSP